MVNTYIDHIKALRIHRERRRQRRRQATGSTFEYTQSHTYPDHHDIMTSIITPLIYAFV